MTDNFDQISTRSGFMKHNGGLLIKKLSETEYQFKTKVTSNHLNRAGITHGGYIASIIDAGSGSAAHKTAENFPCVTISLDIKFIAPIPKTRPAPAPRPPTDCRRRCRRS